jgi:hypothetical protein
MGTLLRRIQISLPESLEEVLSELAEIQERPMSKIVVSLLSEMEPQLRDMVEYTRHMKAGRLEDAKRAIVHMIGNGMAELLVDEKKTGGEKS